MKIIYISGIDGCGKTTQAKRLVEHLRTNGIDAEYQWLRWEPSVAKTLMALKKMFGKKRRAITTRDIKSNEQADNRWHRFKQQLMKSGLFRHFWLYYASNDYYKTYMHAQEHWHSEVVIMDRYIFDFIVDQSINFGVSAGEMVAQFNKTKLSDMHHPDYNVIIDVPAETGFTRKMDGTSLPHLKQREHLYKHHTGDNILHIDGLKPILDIHEQIYGWVTKKMEIL